MKAISVLFMVGAVLITSGCGPTEPPVPGSRTSGAEYVAQEFIKQTLKAPSTAEFPDTEATYNAADDTYTVLGHVDAENSFGAKLRSLWTCTVKNMPDDSWKASKCHLIE